MTKPLSAAYIKGRRKPPGRDRPKEGTKTRRLYDLFITGDKISVIAAMGHAATGFVRALRDDYGLEIVTQAGHNGYSQCVGIWDGDELIPLERLHLDS